MDNIERQLEEIEVLQAIYPEELTINNGIRTARQRLEDNQKNSEYGVVGYTMKQTHTLKLSFTFQFVQLASLERLHHVTDGEQQGQLQLNYSQPSMKIEFPQDYPEISPPLVATKTTSGLDTELLTLIQTCLEEHCGEESTMQLIMTVNEEIQTRNEATVAEYENELELQKQKKEQEQEQMKMQQLKSKSIDVDDDEENNAGSSSTKSVVMIGRRIINSPYILKAAKIKDIKRIADKLKLTGYAKIGKPGIIVIEGPEESCQQYCPHLEDRGWKHQKVKGTQTEEGNSSEADIDGGKTIDEMRLLPTTTFQVLGEDTTVSDLGKLCREGGLAELFFTSLNIHDSFVGVAAADDTTTAGGGGGSGKGSNNNNNNKNNRRGSGSSKGFADCF